MKNKKLFKQLGYTLGALLLVAGGTFAYKTSQAQKVNTFKAAGGINLLLQDINYIPDSIQLGEEIPKEVWVDNTGGTPSYVRLRLKQSSFNFKKGTDENLSLDSFAGKTYSVYSSDYIEPTTGLANEGYLTYNNNDKPGDLPVYSLSNVKDWSIGQADPLENQNNKINGLWKVNDDSYISIDGYWENYIGKSYSNIPNDLPFQDVTYNLDTDNWILDASTGWFYYKTPLYPKESTSQLMSSFVFKKDANNYVKSKPLKIDIDLEGIIVNEDALSSEWKLSKDSEIFQTLSNNK